MNTPCQSGSGGETLKASNRSGTSVALLNAGGVVAGAATIDVRVVDASTPVTTFGGPVTAPFTP